ncbi:cell division cycle-associated protein 2 isoform X2 [Anabas testudineus]|uniref:cell division cycle-associated protein 2 isoform X2 n=1 Tax=Anabas testudineus TaxID=64144 RepID=UPI000E45CD91|nr:cell division cycle-associated protein 2 isoform X2 [Anabas testudineus]
MAKVTTETKTAGTEEELKEETSPSEKEATPVFDDTSAPLNFSKITPSQFGISVQSFIPSSSSHKSTSRLAQIKARRRSSVGVRGSPETNSLIRFMAQQRMKTLPTHQTSEHIRCSPFLPRVASTLRQKMASFQSLMDVEESEVCDPMPSQDSDSGGCIKTRDYLSDGNSLDRGKENSPPMMTPTPTKRRCLAPLEGCEVEIREASAPILHFSLKELEDEEPVKHIVTKGPKQSSETVEEAQAVLISRSLHADFQLQSDSPTKNQQDSAFEVKSPGRTPPDDPSSTQPASPFHMSSLPSLLEMELRAENDCTGTSTVKKKKRVRFGGPLSPELFDKNLPPSTPLQKGGTPARAPTPGAGLRSVLKTPQRIESQTPQALPDLSSPTVFGASPVFAKPRNSRTTSVRKNNEEEEEHGKIVFPSIEEIDSAVMSGTEDTWEAQPLNLNTAFHEESICQMVTESEAKPSTTSQMDEPASFPDKEAQTAAAPIRSRNQRKKLPGPECESTSVGPARSSTRKRKQPEENEPVKRSTRSAAKLASGKMKLTSTATRQWNKGVDRSLYGSREYASKNPALSPITERLSFISQSPAAQHTPSAVCADSDQETCLNPEMAKDTQAAVGGHTVTNALDNPSEDYVTSPHASKKSTTGKDSRLSGPRVRGRGLKKRKVSVVDCDLLSEEPQHPTGEETEETTTNVEESNAMPVEHPVSEQGGAVIESNGPTSADTPSTDSDRTSQYQASLSACLSSDEELCHTLNQPAGPAPRKTKQGRRSSVNSSVEQELRDKVKDHQLNCRVEEMAQGDQACSQHGSRSSSDSQEAEGVANLHLAPWQADFNFEDVFKPVTTRGQRSVRRSLRNQGSAAHSNNSAGLAWMPRTSPESSEEPRRRTRGRRLTAALPVQPSFPEDTQDETS